MSGNDTDIFCIHCKYDSEYSDDCRNPKGLYEVKTPWRLEQRHVVQTEQNANNDCQWFEKREPYKAKGIFKTVLWNVYGFLRGK